MDKKTFQTRAARNKNSDSLQYQSLEPRRMLVGDFNEIVFSADFEDVEVASGKYDHFSEISGLTATQSPIEVQNNVLGVGRASQGDKLLELDGLNGASVTLSEQVSDGLLLRFDYSPRPGVRAGQNSIEIWWNGELLNSVDGNGRRLRSTQFTTYEFGLPAVASGSSTLEFRSNWSRDRKGLGGLIDNINVLGLDTSIDLKPIPDQSLPVGETLEVTAELETPSAEEVTFSILDGPDGLVIDSVTGEVSWTATQFSVDAANTDNDVISYGDPEQVFQTSFESVNVPTGQFEFFESVDGFESTNVGVGVEIQDNHASVGAASDGDQLLELDGRNGVFRNIATNTTDRFQAELDYSPRPGVSQLQNQVELWWGGNQVDVLSSDGSALEGTAFRRLTFDLPPAASESTRLEFRSDDPGDTVGRGGLIDNLVLKRSSQSQASGIDNKFQVIVQASNGSQSTTTTFTVCIEENQSNAAPELRAFPNKLLTRKFSLSFNWLGQTQMLPTNLNTRSLRGLMERSSMPKRA